MNATSEFTRQPVIVNTAKMPAVTARRLADMLAPSDHTGKGNWDANSRIPLRAWPLAIAFAVCWLVVLPWLGIASGF